MPNIGHIVACDEVFNSPNGEFIIKDPLGMIVPVSLPTNYTFVVSVGLINLKVNERYKVEVEMISPTDSKIVKHDLDFEINNSEKDPRVISTGGININFRNIELTEEGDHIITAKIGSSKKELILPVIKRIND